MKRLLLLVPLIAFAACESAVIPPVFVGEFYDFRLQTSPPSVLRWPSGSSVRVFVAAAGDERLALLTDALVRADAEWNRHALFGEYRLVQVNTLTEADVVLRWSDDVSPVVLEQCEPQISRAVTTFCLDDSNVRLLPFPLAAPHAGQVSNVRMVVSVLGGESQRADRVERIARLVAHELGHVLGIAQHSPTSTDLMFGGELTRATLSVRDIATVQLLYHTQAAITP